MSSKGQIVPPAELRQRDRIQSGQDSTLNVWTEGEYRLIRRAANPNEGVIDWLPRVPRRISSVRRERVNRLAGKLLAAILADDNDNPSPHAP